MIVCLRCSEKNDDLALVCKKCGHKLQSRRVEKEGERGGVSVPRPLGLGEVPTGPPLLRLAAEVLGACAALLVALGYGLMTGQWWPVYAAGAAAMLLVILRRS